MNEQELRLKIVEISINATVRVISAAVIGNRSIDNIDYFGLCDPIYEYIKTGKKPDIIKKEET